MKKYFYSLILLLIMISGCNAASNPTDTSEVADSAPNPTQTATSAPTPTITSIPTGTPTPTTLPTETAEPTAEPLLSRTPFLGAIATAEYNEAAILGAFEQYRTALFEQDGAKAIEVIDSFSFKWYEQILFDTLTIDREELDSKEFVEKFTLLRLRHEFSQEELQNFSGEEIIIVSIEKGWVSLETISELEIDEVIIATPPLAYITLKTYRSLPQYLLSARVEGIGK